MDAIEEEFEPNISHTNVMKHEQTTMFFNKYSEDTEIPTVANRLADAIVEYEVSRSIPFNQINDEQIDDEVITEEEFLRNVDDEMDQLIETNEQSDINECVEGTLTIRKYVEDEILNENIDILTNPSEDQLQLLSD